MNLRSLIVLAVVLCSGCAMKVPNPEGCLELTRGNANCSYPFTEVVRRVPARDWALERIGRVSLSPKGYASFILFIEEACAKYQSCVMADLKKNIKAFNQRLGLRYTPSPHGE